MRTGRIQKRLENCQASELVGMNSQKKLPDTHCAGKLEVLDFDPPVMAVVVAECCHSASASAVPIYRLALDRRPEW